MSFSARTSIMRSMALNGMLAKSSTSTMRTGRVQPPQFPCSLMRCEWHSQNPMGTPVFELLYICAENGRNITGWEEDILRARTGRDKKSSNFDKDTSAGCCYDLPCKARFILTLHRGCKRRYA